ncbi:MAG: sigma-70 family RNA polymerase sigma factor [Turneriella sp.]|nr:sigma-70 family RNA polymerase sigma factor [Turneriella sp.]
MMKTGIKRDAAKRNSFDRLTQFYESYNRELMAYALYFTRNEEDAVDALQETFCLAMEDLYNDIAKQVENPKAWLMRIARNVMLRRQTRARQEAILWRKKSESDMKQNNFTFEILNGVLADDILSFIRINYASSVIEVFILRHIHEMNLAEIAEVTGLPMTTIHRLLEKITNDVQHKFCSASGE